MSGGDGADTSSVEGNERDTKLFVYNGQNVSEIPRDMTHLRIGQEVIPDFAFRSSGMLMRLRIGPSVTIIPGSAFMSCCHLTEVVLCDGVVRIKERAFQDCRKLRSICIPSSVMNIGHCCFVDCTSMERVELCEGLEIIETAAFQGCALLKSINLPSTVREIGPFVFDRCVNLTEVELSERLKCIPKRAFMRCSSLKFIKLPNNIEIIEGAAFRECKSLEKVDMLCEGLKEIEGNAFFKCTNFKSIHIPSSVRIIRGAFDSCSQLLSIELCDGVERILPSAFAHCSSLRNLVVPHAARAESFLEPRCDDLIRLFGSQAKIIDSLKTRFDGLPVHKLCYYQSYQQIEVVREQLKETLNGSTQELELQDCLGMTPLHILVLSTRHDIDIYRLIIEHLSNSLVTEDRWGCLPILYAIWLDIPQEILQYLIDSQKSYFPDFVLNWDESIAKLCRTGVSVDVFQRLVGTQQSYFPEYEIDWQKAAKELTVSCIVVSEGQSDSLLTWECMREELELSQMHSELGQSLHEIKQKHFPDPHDIDMQSLCEELVYPLKGWWMHEEVLISFIICQFILRCSISERFIDIGIRKWRDDIESTVISHRPGIGNWHDGGPTFDFIHSKLVTHEHDYQQLIQASCLLELALWKAKLDDSIDNGTSIQKSEARVNCGADVIIPNVLAFLPL